MAKKRTVVSGAVAVVVAVAAALGYFLHQRDVPPGGVPGPRPVEPALDLPARTAEGTARATAPERANDLLAEALEISKELDPETDVAACRAEFRRLVSSIRLELERAKKGVVPAFDEGARAPQQGSSAEPGELAPRQVVEILNRHLLLDRKVSYLSHKYWRDSLFTSALIKRQGNCAAVSTLYYLVARELGLPIRLAAAPRHAYVCWHDEKEDFAIETTACGLILPHDAIRAEFDIGPADRIEAGLGEGLDEEQARALMLGMWARVLLGLDEHERALSLCERACELWPDNLNLKLDRAALLANVGERVEAKLLIDTVLMQAKGRYACTKALMARASVLRDEREFDAAINVLRLAMRRASRTQIRELVMSLGELYRHKRDFPRAIAYHEIAAGMERDENALLELGSVLTEAHRDADAIAAYEEARRMNPENFFPQVILAGLYERTGDAEKGRALFAGIKRPRGSRITWLCSLVWYYAVVGDRERLFENVEAALELDRSGGVYNYFVREPDLDPYRNDPEFVELMEKHGPR